MNLFTHIKSQLSILEIINEYTVLKKAGLYWKGTCPFHNEKTASFTVSPHKEIFYCFGCHAGGDIISFIEKIENCTPMEAAKQLIERYQLTVPEELMHDSSSKTIQERHDYFELCKLTALWMHQMLLKNHAPLAYLRERNITQQSIDYFTIGYFPGGPQSIKSFLDFMQRRNILADDLLQAHILAQGRTVLYSPFEERIIFPIKDHLGRFCGFGGRTYKPHDERAKYYNSRENSYFAKGSLLFGLDLAKQSIQKSEKVFLVEGYTDCIAMVQHGFSNTVATLGTACTIDHLTAIARYAQQLYVLYDGDHAGQEAIVRLTQLCWQVNIELSVICLPAQEDPASFLTKGHNLQDLIENAMDIFVFFIRSLGKDFSSKRLSEKLQLTNKIIALIHKLDDPLKQDILLQKASMTLEIPFASMKEALTRLSKTNKLTEKTPDLAEKTLSVEELNQGQKLEKTIFFAIMHNIHLLNKENEEYLIEYLPNPYQEILKKLKTAKEANPAIDFTHFFDILNREEQLCVSQTLIESEPDAQAQEFEQLVMHLQRKNWKRIVLSIKMKLAQEEFRTDKEKIEKILNSFLELKKKMLHKNLI